MSEMKPIDSGVTAPDGFRASGIAAGIKSSKPDMALVVCDTPARAAGTFTTNRVAAAPVKLCRARVPSDRIRGVIVNSGNANACTGPQGDADAQRMAALAGEALGVDGAEILVCSTGTIGIPLPMEKIEKGIASAADALSQDGGDAAAKAILTTDTVEKQCAVEFTVDGRTVRLGGMAKGAGMIQPHMATMLAFLTTDACVEAAALQRCLAEAVDQSFNRITVDGDQSTNDTVLFLASGTAGNNALSRSHPEWDRFETAVREVTSDLARKIVEDGEGATCLVTVTVRGAATSGDAAMAARAVANSLLVKTSWFGGDPNWGRVIASVGRSGANVDADRVEILYDDVCAVQHGRAAPDLDIRKVEAVLATKRFTLTIDLHLGEGTDSILACDCSEEYVKINSEYMT